MSAAACLLTDRTREFQNLARLKKTLPEEGAQILGKPEADAKNAGGKAAAKGGFMREFFESINGVQSTLNEGRANVKLMNDVLEDALQATTQERELETSQRLQDLVEETNGQVSKVKLELEGLKLRADQEDKKSNAAETRIRSNMQQAMAKKHKQLLVDFQTAQGNYKRALEQRQAKEMHIAFPQASEEEVAEMIDAGETSSLAVAQKMAGTHALLIEEVQRIRDKHRDILKLERSMADLAQMFTEMAVLVDSQGEMLDQIEVHVHKAKGATEKAEMQLILTRKEQHKYQRRICCITLILLMVMMAILGPVLLNAGD